MTGELNNSRFFDEEHMYAFLEGKFASGRFPEASKALAFAKEMHEGQFRKPEDLKIPYIIHPLTLTCHALAMGLEDDILLAALLLHDVTEECKIPPDEMPVCSEVQEIVSLVSKPEEKALYDAQKYFDAIAENPRACMVKCIDRCNNLSTMAVAFSPEKMEEYIQETVTWYLRLLKIIKGVPEFNNAAWLLAYQIKSLIQTIRRFLEEHRAEVKGMLLTEYDEVATMELFKAEGRAEGRAEGALNMLVNLVKKGRMTPAEAAEEANMSVAEFEKQARAIVFG